MLISHRMNGSSAGYHQKWWVPEIVCDERINSTTPQFGFPGAALELLRFAFALADAEML